ncbi:hypothetical protein HDV64DRAFT_290800, partial [Trichoderma sp. TUCIM 5745]
MVPVAEGHEMMVDKMIYEMDVRRNKVTNEVMLVNPRHRMTKKLPNSIEVIKRAIASTNRDHTVDSAILDLTSMSFSMRKRVYTMAKRASMNKKVVVTFGIGRFQEWRQMLSDRMSYIAIDPNIDITTIMNKAKRMTVLPYDFNTPFVTQVASISKKGSTILWAKCKSEYFIDKTQLGRVMAMTGMLAVFSFSISFHIGIINQMMVDGVSIIGCGFIHDSMIATMKPMYNDRGSLMGIVVKFGKSTYVELYLSKSMVQGLILAKDEMPSVWL